MDVLATESLEKLREECLKDPKICLRPLEELVDHYNLVMIPVNYKDIDLKDLQLPQGHTQETNKDLENCKIISNCLGSLTAAEATDERIWATLCFGKYAEYARARWPLDKAKTDKNHVQDHWFARTNRNRMRDNAIARLWWMAHIAQKVPNASYEDVLKTLFFNSDYRSSLLERNSSANAVNVLVSILSISQDAFANNVPFNRHKFREFMKSVDLLGKRTSLPSLTTDELKEVLQPLYKEAYETQDNVKAKKVGILGRILKG